MATERQIAANRRNALRSTGPRTPAGKARVSRNAHRHGLAMPLSANLASAADIQELARAIAGQGADATVLTWAQTAAEAALDLARVRRLRTALIEQRVNGTAADAAGRTMRRLLPELAPFDRYERRAASRRDTAFRAVNRLRQNGIAGTDESVWQNKPNFGRTNPISGTST